MTAKLTEWKIKSVRKLNFFFKIIFNLFFFLNLLLILFRDKIFQPDNFESLAVLLYLCNYLHIFMFPLISIFIDNDFFYTFIIAFSFSLEFSSFKKTCSNHILTYIDLH